MTCKAIDYKEGTYGIHGCVFDEGHEDFHLCYKLDCGHTWSDKDHGLSVIED